MSRLHLDCVPSLCHFNHPCFEVLIAFVNHIFPREFSWSEIIIFFVCKYSCCLHCNINPQILFILKSIIKQSILFTTHCLGVGTSVSTIVWTSTLQSTSALRLDHSSSPPLSLDPL